MISSCGVHERGSKSWGCPTQGLGSHAASCPAAALLCRGINCLPSVELLDQRDNCRRRYANTTAQSKDTTVLSRELRLKCFFSHAFSPCKHGCVGPSGLRDIGNALATGTTNFRAASDVVLAYKLSLYLRAPKWPSNNTQIPHKCVQGTVPCPEQYMGR